MPYPKQTARDSISPSQVSKLYWVAGMMALIAGYINSAMLIEFSIPVSQMSGVASNTSEYVMTLNWRLLGTSMAILFSFILGAFISGLLIGQKAYNTTPNYGYGLVLNCALLTLAAILSFQHSFFSVLLSAVACGIQNALIASYRGLRLRTTHMTGNATDIGVHLAARLKSGIDWTWKSTILIVLLVAYIVGGMIGIYAYLSIPHWALVFPGLLTGLLGAVYLRNFARRQVLL